MVFDEDGDTVTTTLVSFPAVNFIALIINSIEIADLSSSEVTHGTFTLTITLYDGVATTSYTIFLSIIDSCITIEPIVIPDLTAIVLI